MSITGKSCWLNDLRQRFTKAFCDMVRGSTVAWGGPRMTVCLFWVPAMTPECQLFGTLGCHLCEVAEGELMPFVEHGLLVELVDIAENQALFEAYGLRIPVLRRIDSGAELNWPFDSDQVAAFLR